MKVIGDEIAKIEYKIKRSRFICLIKYIETEAEAIQFINTCKQLKATHNCFAYISNSHTVQRYNDDGEPTHTAGFIMLSWLLQQNFTNIVVLNIRYYGSIPLGKSGLIRAYKQGLEKLMSQINIYTLKTIYEYHIKILITQMKLVSNIINSNGGSITKQVFSDNVLIIFTSNHQNWNEILSNKATIVKTLTNKIKINC